MIVTCPGCSSKYRVKNDSVPTDGARMKCPKCDTMFLAKPPPPGAGGGPHLEEPSSQFQQIAPQTPAPQPPQPAPAPAPAVRAAGPVTALFGAVDPSQLPAEFLPAAPHTPAPASAPSPDLATAPKVRTPVTQPQQPARTMAPGRPRWGVPIGVAALGGIATVVGGLVFCWTTEILPLDRALTPVFAPFGAKPLVSDDPSVDALRETAKTATERGDLVAALLAWQRLDAITKDDRQARTEMAALREKLGEQQTR